MNDYGIKPITLLFLAIEDGYYPKDTDLYNPHLPNIGNSNYGRDDARAKLFWDGSLDAFTDIRLFYTFRQKNEWTRCRWDPADEDLPKYWRISMVSDYQICYTTEALKYA
jgi:hypothetical protein